MCFTESCIFCALPLIVFLSLFFVHLFVCLFVCFFFGGRGRAPGKIDKQVIKNTCSVEQANGIFYVKVAPQSIY